MSEHKGAALAIPMVASRLPPEIECNQLRLRTFGNRPACLIRSPRSVSAVRVAASVFDHRAALERSAVAGNGRRVDRSYCQRASLNSRP